MISKNAVIAFLLFSAAVLSCIFVFQATSDPSIAWAADNSRAGILVVATAAVQNDTDLLWVTNVDLQRMVVYGMDNGDAINVLGSVDLAQVFQGRRARVSALTP